MVDLHPLWFTTNKMSRKGDRKYSVGVVEGSAMAAIFFWFWDWPCGSWGTRCPRLLNNSGTYDPAAMVLLSILPTGKNSWREHIPKGGTSIFTPGMIHGLKDRYLPDRTFMLPVGSLHTWMASLQGKSYLPSYTRCLSPWLCVYILQS